MKMKEAVKKRNTGVNFSSEGKAEVLLWAPLALSVEIDIAGKKTIPLNEREYGYWYLETLELKPGDSYLFKLDGKNSFTDPASLYQPQGVHQPSVAYDLNQFQWSDKDWFGINSKELIIYELHVGTFSSAGTFDGIISRIDYFKELGITAIEIMPVAQFPGSRNWGYDGVYPFAVQESYGGPEGLKQLVNAFHQEKIAVILDVVYNHLGPEGNYLLNFAHYFTDKYKTPWGNAINFDDEWCDGVRQYYIENALMWLRDFHIDGLRLDAVHAIKDFGATHILEDIKEHVSELNSNSNFKHFLIGESDLNDVRFINPPERGGYDLDHQWVDEFHHSIHALVTGERIGYYSDFGSLACLEKSFNEAYVYDGIYSPHRKKTFGSKTTGQSREKFIVFSQNHDQVGNRMRGDRLSTQVSFEMLKLIAGAVFISPFIPMIFMGEEYGETNPFLYFTSHGDEELIHLVREGRKNEFKDFVGSGETFHDPQSPETFNASKLNFVPDNNNVILLDFYRELIRLKKQHLVIRHSDRDHMTTSALSIGNVLLHTKRWKNNYLAAILNFDKSYFLLDYTGWEEGQIHVLVNSAERKWGGSGEDYSAIKEVPFISLKNFIEPVSNNKNNPCKSSQPISPESILILSDVVI